MEITPEMAVVFERPRGFRHLPRRWVVERTFCQVLKPNDAVWVLFDNLLSYGMVGVGTRRLPAGRGVFARGSSCGTSPQRSLADRSSPYRLGSSGDGAKGIRASQNVSARRVTTQPDTPKHRSAARWELLPLRAELHLREGQLEQVVVAFIGVRESLAYQ